jgi:protein-tyrosine-phosphatase
MAAAILQHTQGGRIFVDCAGVRAQEIDGFAVAVMDEIGIDISHHQAKTFDDLEDTSFDLVISLSPEAQHKAVELTRTMDCVVEFWPVFDPTVVEGDREARLEAYRTVRDHLLRRIRERFPRAPASQV